MPRVYTPAEFKTWLARALPGERVIYAVRDYGEGPVRRKPNFSSKTDPRNPRSMADSEELFAAAKDACEKREVALTRLRVPGTSCFDCFAERTAAPLAGVAHFHPSVAPRDNRENAARLVAESRVRLAKLEKARPWRPKKIKTT